MSEMSKEDFENSFEQQWQEAFEGAELSPNRNLWDNIESKLAETKPHKSINKQGNYLYTMLGICLLAGTCLQKTTSNLSKQTLPKNNTQATTKKLPIYDSSLLPVNATIYTPILRTTLPTNTPQAGKQMTLPTSTPQAGKSALFIIIQFKQQAHKHVTSKIHELVGKCMQGAKENASEMKLLPVLGMRPLAPCNLQSNPISLVVYATPQKQLEVKRFWVSIQRGVTLASPKVAIHYDNYLRDYAQAHQFNDGIDLSNFFTEVNEKAQYSVANQADIKLGCQVTPHWQISGGVQYRAEFLEQSTNAFFVNYYDYTRHSFLLDILEGNINNPNFAQAIASHPAYRPTGDNSFSISQFNQQSVIHIASRFEYIGVPVQVLGAGQVDKLIRSSTSSYELQDNVAIAYRLNTAAKLSTWSWQIGGGAEIAYKYSAKWAITANSLYFQNIKPIKENKYVAIRPRGLQVNVGAKYMF